MRFALEIVDHQQSLSEILLLPAKSSNEKVFSTETKTKSLSNCCLNPNPNGFALTRFSNRGEEKYYHDSLKAFVHHHRTSSSLPFESQIESQSESNTNFDVVFLSALATSSNSKYSSTNNSTPQTKSQACKERDVWSLCSALRSTSLDHLSNNDRSSASANSNFEMMLSACSNLQATPARVVKAVQSESFTFSRRSSIITWAENTASESTSFLRPSVIPKRNEMWPCTLKRLNSNTSAHKTIDPDAPLRAYDNENSVLPPSLDETDAFDEAAMLKSCLLFIRAGQVGNSAKLCVDSGQPWRAATLLGGSELEISNCCSDANLNYLGNPCFPLWRRHCWELGRKMQKITDIAGIAKVGDSTYDPAIYESAIYASLANDHELLLQSPTMRTWLDGVWIYFRALNQRSIDETITLHSSLRRKVADKFPYSGSGNSLAQKELEQLAATESLTKIDEISIFEKLTNSQYEEVSSAASDPYYLAIAAVIKGGESICEFFRNMWGLLGTNEMGIELLRFSVHLVIYFNRVERELTPSTEMNDLIIAYVEHLVEVREIKLVALYCSLLPMALCIKEYTSFLLVVEDPQERLTVLNLGNFYFEETVLDILRNVGWGIISHEDCEDGKKLHALNWFSYGYGGLDGRYEFFGIMHANGLLRSLLLENKLEIAKNLVSQSGVGDDYEWANLLTGVEPELTATVDSTVNEHKCYRAFLQSHCAFEDFRSVLSDVETNIRVLNSEGNSSHNSSNNKQKSNKLNAAEREMYSKLESRKLAEKLSEQIEEVLTYAQMAERKMMEALEFEGGFLNMGDDEIRAFEENANRTDEIDRVRRFVIPLTLSMTHSIFDCVGRFLYTQDKFDDAENYYDKALGLSVLLCKSDDFVNLIGNDNLQEFLRVMADTYVEKMRAGKSAVSK